MALHSHHVLPLLPPTAPAVAQQLALLLLLSHTLLASPQPSCYRLLPTLLSCTLLLLLFLLLLLLLLLLAPPYLYQSPAAPHPLCAHQNQWFPNRPAAETQPTLR
jgi:hypothetical protein